MPGHAKACEDAYKYPQGSACFIQSVGDDMRDIMALATSEAMLFKYGSGTARTSRRSAQAGSCWPAAASPRGPSAS